MDKKPNIVFVLNDDHGYWALGCAGNKEIVTPNIDRLAREGMLFENFFCASPVCSPARASLLTGSIPSYHGVHDWIRSGSVDGHKFKAQGEENPYGGYKDEDYPIKYLEGKLTYTDVLAENGYTCALSGKWHLGDSVSPQHGFTKWYTIGKGGCFYYHPDIVENGNIELRHGEYITSLITDKAIDMIDELKGKEEPFYLSVHYTAPHSPWEADQHPKKWIDYYDKCKFETIPDIPDHPDISVGKVYNTPKRHENLRGYFAAISAMDEELARLIDKLEKEKLLDNTIFIFTADNGMNMGHHGIWGKGNGTHPMNMFDTSVKVPFIIRYPKFIKGGTRSVDMVSAYDLFPTLLDILGLNKSYYKNKPGKSFLKSLKGISQDDENSIVIFDEYGPVRMIRTSKWKYIHRYPYGYHELYDLEKDPEENNNLYSNSEYNDIIITLRKKLESWFDKYSNKDLDGLKEGVTGLGQLSKAGLYASKKLKYYPIDKED